MTTLRWLTVPVSKKLVRLRYTGPDKDQQQSEQWALFPVESREEGEGSLVVQVASILSTILVSPPLPLVYLWISSSSVARRMERGGEKESSFREDTFERWKIARRYTKVIAILVLSRNCIANGPSFESLEERNRLLSMAASCTIVSQWLIVETRWRNVKEEREKASFGKSSLNVNDNLESDDSSKLSREYKKLFCRKINKNSEYDKQLRYC